MKVSKMRAKARAAFRRWTSIWFRTEDGVLHDCKPGPLFESTVPYVEVVVIRGRQFTLPQTKRVVV